MGAGVQLAAVTRSYPTGLVDHITALHEVSLAVSPGEMVAIMGPSGSGKSTLLHVIGAMDSIDEGTVEVGDWRLNALTDRQRTLYRRTVGFVFQRFHLLPALTALENVAAPVLPLRTEFDKFERAAELLSAVGLKDRASALPAQLSGGQQQRVAIARALINNPALLLADEPTGNIDSAASIAIMDLVVSLRDARDMTVLVATHDEAVADRCDRVVLLRDGRIAVQAGVRD